MSESRSWLKYEDFKITEMESVFLFLRKDYFSKPVKLNGLFEVLTLNINC